MFGNWMEEIPIITKENLEKYWRNKKCIKNNLKN